MNSRLNCQLLAVPRARLEELRMPGATLAVEPPHMQALATRVSQLQRKRCLMRTPAVK